MRSSHDNLKPKEGEGAKAGELNASKGWFDNFRKRFGFRNVKITGKAASADHKAAGEFPHTIMKIIEEKGYLPEQTLSRHNSLFWKKCYKGCLSVRERRVDQDLRQEGIG